MTPGQLFARTLVGAIVCTPWFHAGGTLAELGVCVALGVLVAWCMPDTWTDVDP